MDTLHKGDIDDDDDGDYDNNNNNNNCYSKIKIIDNTFLNTDISYIFILLSSVYKYNQSVEL
jgi:hypothetical protein